MVVGGSVSIGWGVSQIIAGFFDNDIGVPKPSAASLSALVTTGSIDNACNADFAEDMIMLGKGIGGMAGKMPSNLDLVGSGLSFVGISAQSKSMEEQFKK